MKVRYVVHDGALAGEFRSNGIELTLPTGNDKTTRLRMVLQGSNPDSDVAGESDLESRTNYLLGNDPKQWVRGVPNYARLRYHEVYPGIDLLFYGNGRSLEHDFEVLPGADPSQIVFRLLGAKSVWRAHNGDLMIAMETGQIAFERPVAYQEVNGKRMPVRAEFQLARNGSVRFRLGQHDASRKLVIDPALSYATYLDQLSDGVGAVAADAAGNTYITGYTFNTTYPVTSGAFQKTCAGCPNSPVVYVTKLNATGTAQVYSTFLGGSGYNQPFGLAIDSNGNAVVGGYTQSTDFPLKNPVAAPPSGISGAIGFISSLSPDGSTLNYSSLLGDGMTYVYNLAADGQGNAYITGVTDSPNYPVTPGALHTVNAQYPEFAVFVSKFTPAGALSYSAIVGDATPQTGGGGLIGATAIAVDSNGSAYITGSAGGLWPTTAGAYGAQPASPPYRAVFITKITPDGSAMAFSTLLDAGIGNAIALDSSKNAYIAGQSDTTSFPVTSNAYLKAAGSCCSFFSEVSADGSQLTYSSFFGGATGNGYTNINALRLDGQGNIWLAGSTSDLGFPLVNPLQSQLSQGQFGLGSSSFLSEFDPTGTQLKFSTYLGDLSNSGLQFAFDAAGKIHAAGTTAAPIYTTPGAFLTTLTAPPQYVQIIYPYALLIDPSRNGSEVCIVGSAGQGLYFPTLLPNSTSTLSLQVENCGTADLTITSITSSNPEFTVSSSGNTCTNSVTPNSTCSFSVVFEPTAVQSYTGQLTIKSNASIGSNSVSLNGAGGAPTAIITQQIYFQPLLVGQTSPSAAAVLQNSGPVPMTIDLAKVAITGGFALASGGSCTGTLPAYGSCTFDIQFTPTSQGANTGSLTVPTSDPVHPIVSTSLLGTAFLTYPAPTIAAVLNPSFPINSGTQPVSVSVFGSNFFPVSTVYLNGVAQTTNYQSSIRLTFNLNPAVLTAPGQIPVTVVTPSPGGGTSVAYPLIGYISIPLMASALTVDPVGGLLYAAIPASAMQNPNTVIPIDPATGQMKSPIAVANDPNRLAISDDGTELYVASANELQRINLKTLAIEKTFDLPVDSSFGQTTAYEMHTVPGSPKSIVVVLFDRASPSQDGAALYDDSGLVNWIPYLWPSYLALNSFTFASSPSVIYGLPGAQSFFTEVKVSPSGLTYTGGLGFGGSNGPTGPVVRSDGALLYTSGGQVWDPSSQKLLGTYLAPNGSPLFYPPSVVPDTANKHTYILDTASQYYQYQAANIDVYDQTTYALLGTVPFTGIFPPDVSDLVRWGTNGFAFRSADFTGSDPTQNQIVIVTTPLVGGTSVAPIPILLSVSPSPVYAGSPGYTMQLTGSGFTATSKVMINNTARSTTFVNSTSLTAPVLAADIVTPGQLSVQVMTPAPGGGTSSYVYVSIQSSAPQASLSQSALSFGSVGQGVTSASQTVQLSNPGSSPLNISSIAASGDFTSTNNCPASLAENASCTITVTMTPTSQGPRTGTLTVSDNATPTTQAVSLQGTGVASFTFAPTSGGSTSASVTSGGTAKYNLQLTAASGLSGTVNLSCSGAPANANCSISPTTLGLTSGGSGTFTVTVTTQTLISSNRSGASNGLMYAGLVALLALQLAARKRGRRLLQLLLLLTATLCLQCGLAGCGGGGGGGTQPPAMANTPPGTYALTVTATMGHSTTSQNLTLVIN